MLAMVGARAFSLAAGRASGGVYCGPDGLFVDDIPLLKRDGPALAWSVRPIDALNDELTARYWLPIDIAAKANALTLIAHAFNGGDIAMAAIAAVQMQLPDPPLAKTTETHDQILDRAAELHRIGLLKFWDPVKHPRVGAPPNPGWFAPIDGAGQGAPARTHLVMSPGERRSRDNFDLLKEAAAVVAEAAVYSVHRPILPEGLTLLGRRSTSRRRFRVKHFRHLLLQWAPRHRRVQARRKSARFVCLRI